MRFVYSNESIDISFSANTPLVLVIEKKDLFSIIVSDLWRQSSGEEGKCILSNINSTLELNKDVVFIIDPFSVNYNEKRVLTSVYEDLDEICNSNYWGDVADINTRIIELLEAINDKSEFHLTYKLNFQLKELLKIYNVKLLYEDDSLLDRISSYIKLLHRVRNVKLIIFVNLKTFLNDEQLNLLFKECLYEDICIMDIENVDFGKSANEKYVIIDKDLCKIIVDD